MPINIPALFSYVTKTHKYTHIYYPIAENHPIRKTHTCIVHLRSPPQESDSGLIPLTLKRASQSIKLRLR